MATGKSITPGRFRSLLGKGSLKGVIMFSGDRGLVERMVDETVDALAGPEERELIVAVLHADEVDERRLLTEVRTLPMFADRRIVVVRQAQKFIIKDKKSPFAAYIEEPVDSTLLLLSAPDADKRKRLYTLVKKHGIVVHCQKLNRKSAPAFVRAEVEAAGKRIDQSAVNALVEMVGTDAALLANEVRNLVGFVGDRDAITEEDVLAMTANLREENIFNLTEAIAARNVGLALATMEQLFNENAEPIYILSMIDWLLRRLYGALMAVEEGAAPQKAAEMAGVPPYFRKKFVGQMGRFSISEIVHLLDLLLDTDIGFRQSGRTPQVAMELFVIRAAGNQRARALR